MSKIKRLTAEDRQRAWHRYYQEGASSGAIAAELGVSDVAIRATLKRMGGVIRGASDAHRSMPVNEQAFDVLTPEALYWLGVLMSDGCVSDPEGSSSAKVSLTWHAGDRDHLLALDRFTGGDGVIDSPNCRVRRKAARGGRFYFRWELRSAHMAATLGRYGILPRKSKTAVPTPELAASPDFWRGMWDGDGEVDEGNNCPALSLVGSFPMIQSFCDFFSPRCPEYPLKPRASSHTDCTAYAHLYGHGAMVLLRTLYEGAAVAMPRKAQKAAELLERFKDRNFRILKVDIRQADTFPFVYTDLQDAHHDFTALQALDAAALVAPLTKVAVPGLEASEIQRSRVGVVASHTFHERVRMGARVRGYRSPLEVWADPVERQKIVDEAENRKHSSLRASMSANCRPCWGFIPAIAKAVYQHFGGDQAQLRILDPSAGWGDRLTAALALPNLGRYLGVDPNRAMAPVYERIRNCFAGAADAQVITAAFEDVEVPAGAFDIAFTSPPYFDYEEYSDDPEQSFKRYATAEAWRDGFLHQLIDKSAAALVAGGVLAVNISDAGRAPAARWLAEHASAHPDLRFIGTMLMPTGNFTRASEGIYCWRKTLTA